MTQDPDLPLLDIAICPRCGAVFSYKRRGIAQVYCRTDCGHADIVCEMCGITFKGILGRRYCGAQCTQRGMFTDRSDASWWTQASTEERAAWLTEHTGEGRKTELSCEICQGPFRGRLGRRYCGALCTARGRFTDRSGLGAWAAMTPDQQAAHLAHLSTLAAKPQVRIGLRYEHRAVAAAALGRALYPGEVVHHEDQDRDNNNRGNLIVFPSEEVHLSHHKLGHCLMTTCPCPGIRLKDLAQ